MSVGVPANVANWGRALDRWGTRRLAAVLRPAERIARRGFPLKPGLVESIGQQQTKLARFRGTAAQYLPGGKVPRVGRVIRNADLARTYALIGRRGWRWFYTGPIARELAATVRRPPVAAGKAAVAGGAMTAADLRRYRAVLRAPVSWTYRGYKLFSMAPPSSGGTTIGEAMNILERVKLSGDRVQALHRYLEASKLAYADRGRYVADPDQVNVPVRGLLSKGFAAQRAGLIGATALTAPAAPGDPCPFNGSGPCPSARAASDDGLHTNHLVADRFGNVVSYTNTTEQVAGSGITVPGRGFLLNNELTDFNFPVGTANSLAPNKRPRSSMSPTIVTRRGRVVEALGARGGATIITQVLQTLINQIDFGMSLPAAIEAPRASQRNAATTESEPAFIARYGADLQLRGQAFVPQSMGYIGQVTAVALLPRNRFTVATESWRGGGGSAMVVRPGNPVPEEAAVER